MRVLRIERRDGSGPYAGFFNSPCMEPFLRGNLWDKQPTPFNDGMPQVYSSLHFGFKNDDQLLTWFDPSHPDAYEQLLNMAEQDFVIVEYDCRGKVIEGKSQIAFEKHRAIKLNELPLSQLVS